MNFTQFFIPSWYVFLRSNTAAQTRHGAFLWCNSMLILKQQWTDSFMNSLPSKNTLIMLCEDVYLSARNHIKVYLWDTVYFPIILHMETLKSIIHDCIIINQRQQSLRWATCWRLEAETVKSKAAGAHWYSRHRNLGWERRSEGKKAKKEKRWPQLNSFTFKSNQRVYCVDVHIFCLISHKKSFDLLRPSDGLLSPCLPPVHAGKRWTLNEKCIFLLFRLKRRI